MKETIRLESEFEKAEEVTAEKLELLAAEIEKLKKREEDIIYKISHDLQQPITTMIGYLGLVERRYGESFDEKGKKFLENIRLSSEKLSGVLKSLLEFSRIGKFGELELVDCNQIVNDMWRELKTDPISAVAELECEKLPSIMANSYDIYMLFFHLAKNGILYQKPGSVPKIAIRSEKIDQGWKIEVEDNGLGIPEEFQQKIFELLYRLHSSSDYPGSGVGLALCEKIVENLGGKIGCKSVEGKGSCFYFTLLS